MSTISFHHLSALQLDATLVFNLKYFTMKPTYKSLAVYLLVFPLLLSACTKFLETKPNQALAVPRTLGDLQAMLDTYYKLNNNDPGSSETSADNYYLSDLPGGGGTKELLIRFTGELANYEEVDYFAAVKRAFKLIAFATTSTSAFEARAYGYLRASDRISMNRDHQIADAKRRVLDLAPGYLPPLERSVRALGREGLGNLEYALWAAKEGGQASAHDVRVGRAIAYVLCGGDGTPRDVTEQDILDLEREQFLMLLGTKETQERIAYTLKTGKPLRN